MRAVRRFTIDRRTWLCGEGTSPSRLLRRSDGKACVLGWYLRACGVPDVLMADVACPTRLPLDAVPAWIRNGTDVSCVSHAAALLMSINDDDTLDDATREGALTQLAARRGLSVTFVDGPPVRRVTPRK